MNFETEFTELAATVGSEKNAKSDGVLFTKKQWAFIIVVALLLAGGIELWLRASGL